MSFKQTIAKGFRAIAQVPGLRSILYAPGVRSTLQKRPGFAVIYGRGWDLLHPFDRALGTDTSGYVAAEDLPSSPYDTEKKHCYAGSQPGIIRAALATLPALAPFSFVDLGCGRGRPLLVATEFPFREIVGVELAPDLVAQARTNAAEVRRRFPQRVPVRVEVGDASLFPFPEGDLVVFLYNPFGAEVIQKVIARLEAACSGNARRLFVVYYNPVFGALFDASPVLRRHFAGTLPYAAEELGFGPDEADPVVIWQAGSELPPVPGAETSIVVTKASMRAELRA